MPVLDWTRTALAWPVAHGGRAMRFDLADFAAFDIHVLKRKGAVEDYPETVAAEAARRFAGMDDGTQKKLAGNVIAGLPGTQEHWSLDTLSAHLSTYDGIGPEKLRNHLTDFLGEVAPHAEGLGVRMCCHPDDPPFGLLGLPRIMSTLSDYRHVLQAVDVPANGVTFCTGSLGARPDNDLPAIVEALGPHIHFVHLRNVTRDTEEVPCSFFEDEHLNGQADMVAVIAALLAEEKRRRGEGRTDTQIPMRPDHGQEILDDLKRGAQPGYPAIGRLKGLAELRGVMKALNHPTLGA
jgi:mannonate dehydratase